MNSAAIDGLLAQAVQDGSLPGVIATVGDGEGVLYEGIHGRVSVEDDEPVRADTLFWIASMTKPLVSVAAVQLIERGELELEQEVAEILPAFGELSILEGFDGESPRLRQPTRTVTVRHLLTHTSGCGYWFDNPDVLRYHRITGVPDPLSGSAEMLRVPRLFEAGERWEYGTSIDWLGLVVEKIGGADLDTHLRTHICQPLGMHDTTFDPTDAQRERLMAIHDARPGQPLTLSSVALPEEQDIWSGGGGLYSTAGDYMRFMRALLRGGELDGERILRPESVELAFTDHLRGAPLPADGTHSAVPELTKDVPALPFKQGFGLGFNLMLEDIPGMRRAGTGNWAGLCNSYFWIDRASGIAATLMTQLLPFFDDGIVPTLLGFEASVYAA
jgi:CubicO group peptidase (beta-lactamase class C family)